jgi:precorrin-4 methylase
MNLDCQILAPTKFTAMALSQGIEAYAESGSVLFKDRDARSERSLQVHLTIHTLERAVRMLIPFYGPDCSIAIYDDGESESLIGRSTLGAIAGWTPRHQSLLLLIG